MSSLDMIPETKTEHVKKEAVLEERFAELKHRYGLQDRRTLWVFFELFDVWIVLHRLNKADQALVEVVPVCEWRRDELTIKAVQALAFTRWRQGRHKEALERFHEIEGWMGKTATMSENIGHTYNAIGAFDEAEQSFKEALEMTRNRPAHTHDNEGGILLGLAGLQERRKNYDEALPNAEAAFEYYTKRDEQRGWTSSTSAKALMQITKIQLKLGNWKTVESKAREAVRIFELTGGNDSPFLVGALERQGNALVRLGRVNEGRKALYRAYKVAALQGRLDLIEILEVHDALVSTYMHPPKGETLDGFRKYFKAAKHVERRVRKEMKQDGNAGAFYKAAGEMFILGGECGLGRPLLVEAIQLFQYETVVDTRGLIRQCGDLVTYCDGGSTAVRKAQLARGEDPDADPGPRKKRLRRSEL